MGRKAFIAVICWLMLNGTSAKAVAVSSGTSSSVEFIDNISAESAPRLYRNVPLGVYASATPYAAYSFNVPSFVAPKSTHVIPVKEESVVVQNTNGFLRDSYGQRFVETPQSVAYKTTFPQQFVQLQNLPAHLSQPLVAASPNFQLGHAPSHFFGTPQFGISNLQALSPSHLNHYTVSQPIVYADNNIRTLSPQVGTKSQVQSQSVAQQQPTSSNNIYLNAHLTQQYHQLNNPQKFQRLQQEPKSSSSGNNNKAEPLKQEVAVNNKLQTKSPKETIVTTGNIGKKTYVRLVTKPPVPLLDLTLLEPLTFTNPLVPQVQHFLPRINQATYHKLPDINEVKKHEMEFVVQNTKSYDSGLIKDKPKNEPKKKQRKQTTQQEVHSDEEVQPTPSITVNGVPNESPEFSYEINSPNYKETYKEQNVNYNKETQSEPVNVSYDKQTQHEPVHYTYEKHTEKKPVQYSYVHSSKEPEQVKQVYYDNNSENPKHLVYRFRPEENDESKEHHGNHTPQNESEDYSKDEDNSEIPPQYEPYNIRPQHQSQHKENSYNPEQREVKYHKHLRDAPESRHNNHNKVVQNVDQYFQPIVPEYEEDIKILPTHRPHAPIHLDQNYNQQSKPNKKHNSYSGSQNQQAYHPQSQTHYFSTPAAIEKSKRIIVKDEEPKEVDVLNEELMEKMTKKQEESEEDFDKAYKDAAYGFPAYDAPSMNVEKEIYNPEAYGASRYHDDYDVEKTPLRQYQAGGDDFPEYTRGNYKDARDKTSEEYFLDYAISRPQSLHDRFKKKENYYEMFKKHKPERHFASQDDDKKKHAKYTAVPYEYHGNPQQKQYLSKYKAAPQKEEYDYYKEAPHDNSAYATRPHYRYKSKTQFVEPQYQYGFEPVSIPQLLDSELAAMASNNRPESEKPGARKKVYKENFYIKKTNTKGGKSAS